VLHRTSVSPIPHSDKITQFIKAKQQKNKAIDQIFLFKEKKKTKNNSTISELQRSFKMQ
jgi:hypothetical protein